MRQYINFQSKPMEIYKVLNFGLNQSPESLKARDSSPNLNNQIGGERLRDDWGKY